MGLEERLNEKVSMTVLQRQSMIVVTLLATLLLLNIWPRFWNDASSVPWFVYLILIVVFLIPWFRGK